MYARVVLAAALALGTSVAAAQEAGWYGGLDLGASHLSGIDLGDSLDRSETGYGLNLGYRINRNFAVEGAYRSIFAKAGWDHYDKAGTDATGDGHVDLYSLGVGYRF